MRKQFFLISFIAAIALLCASGCYGQPTAESVLVDAYRKCRTIQGGHYEMERRMRSMSGNDTAISRYICDFRKMPDDTIFGKVFDLYGKGFNGDIIAHYLYTGNEFVIFRDDSIGTRMQCDMWADEIFRWRGSCVFYKLLTNSGGFPLSKDLELMEGYSYALSETRLDGKSCYQVTVTCPEEALEAYGLNIIRHELELWFDKTDYLPLKYAEFFEIVQRQDTMYQYEECRLLAFNPDVDESKLSLENVYKTFVLKDYNPTPQNNPETLPTGSSAPEWSLPALSGDTVSLADLKGKVVLIDFFYKKCAPCCAAMLFLQRMHEKYSDKGFVLVGIDPYDDPEKDGMADFLSKRGITYTVLFSGRELCETYRIWCFPTLFFLDRDGRIVMVETGYGKNREEVLEKKLVEMLQK